MRLANSRAPTLEWLNVVGCFRKQSRMGENEAGSSQPPMWVVVVRLTREGSCFVVSWISLSNSRAGQLCQNLPMCLFLCHVFRYLVTPRRVWGLRKKPTLAFGLELIPLGTSASTPMSAMPPSLQAEPG